MAIENIRTRLTSDLTAITGIQRVFHDQPNVSPAAADCPCFVLGYAKPSVTANGDTNGMMEYTWHLSVKFLFKPLGQGNPDENLSGAEDYFKSFVDALAADITVGGTWRDWNKDTATLAANVGVLQTEYSREWYWGWDVPLDINEQVATTFSAGS